jgi:hypothetical protein
MMADSSRSEDTSPVDIAVGAPRLHLGASSSRVRGARRRQPVQAASPPSRGRVHRGCWRSISRKCGSQPRPRRGGRVHQGCGGVLVCAATCWPRLRRGGEFIKGFPQRSVGGLV